MDVNPKILMIRVLLGLLFAFLLAHFFFPSAGFGTIIGMAAVLVFFAYVFEAIHRREK
jgi:FtsH-binding integral membrane protein